VDPRAGLDALKKHGRKIFIRKLCLRIKKLVRTITFGILLLNFMQDLR
jgi:hypothetical protein